MCLPWHFKGGDSIAGRKPFKIMGDYLRQQPRDIVYNLCQYGMGDVWKWGDDVGGQCWRTTNDITDTWESVKGIALLKTVQLHGRNPVTGMIRTCWFLVL